MNTVKTNSRTFKSRAKCNAYMTRFTAIAKRLGMIPHYDIAINGRSIVITLTARPIDVQPCANAMRPLCKDKNDLINNGVVLKGLINQGRIGISLPINSDRGPINSFIPLVKTL